MTHKSITLALLPMALAISTSALAQGAASKPGNCVIYAEMSAITVEKDSRFDAHGEIELALVKFAKAQAAKLEKSREQSYEASKLYGWNKQKVDFMIETEQTRTRAGFFTPTMDPSKLYMDHVQAVLACVKAQTDSADLGQPKGVLMAVVQKMAKIVIK